jgi:hypothetical protein
VRGELPYWADRGKNQRQGQINHGDGGRGALLERPDGHYLEDHHPALRQAAA